MAQAPKMCFDRILPTEISRPHRMMAIGGRLQAVFEFRKRWVNGSTLSVRFMEGTDAQKALVREQADWWTEHANLHFDFNDAPNADIRITFDQFDGAWSFLGTDAKNIPLGQATMNLGFLDGGTAAHEFGHAIGLGHEHQNPQGGIEWKRDEVIADLSGPPNNWSVAQIEHNVLEKYSHDQIKGTVFDPESIMLYFFPGRWTESGVGTEENEELSELDKAFIASADAYPGRNTPPPETVEIPVVDTSGVAADIGAPGEEDLFTFTVDQSGRHTVETGGQTDLVMKLFGPDSQTALIAEDDDGGSGTNPRIVADLGPGEYTVQIRHFNVASGTGSYSIRVLR